MTDPAVPSGGSGSPVPESIAIIGIGCRFAGGDGPDVLEAGEGRCRHDHRDATGRFDFDAAYDWRPGATGKIVTRQGGLLSSLDQFDAGFFGISPVRPNCIDPQQR